jgi:phosphatidylglycerophosphate synthase
VEENAATGPIASIVGSSAVPLWGLTGSERLRRQLRAVGISDVRASDAPLPRSGTVLLLRADHLFEERTLRDLAANPGTLLCAGERVRSSFVAAHVPAARAERVAALLNGAAQVQELEGVRLVTPAQLSSAYLGKLLKAVPPAVLKVEPERTAALERHLFDGSYKGVTDLVTKWLWPTPARWVTGLCARAGIRPNAVTGLSLVLAVAALLLFARGWFGAGLAAAWVMTFLDTVDGKLARVTVTSSQFGHLFDHIIDLVHPPLWYAAWAYGVAGDTAHLGALAAPLIAILAGYVGGRLVEGTFEFVLSGFSLFSWRPVDSYFRLITARRNPNLLLLTLAAVTGLPRQGLVAVAVWTALSTAFLLVRLGQAAYVRLHEGELRSWLQNIGTAPAPLPSYARPFAPGDTALGQITI